MSIFDWGWNAQSVVDKTVNPVAPMPQNIIGGVAVPPYDYQKLPTLDYAGMPDPYGAVTPQYSTTTPLNLTAFPDPYGDLVPKPPVAKSAVPTPTVPTPAVPSVPSVMNGFSASGMPTVTGSDSLSNSLRDIFSGQVGSTPALDGQTAGTSGNWITNTFMDKDGGLNMGNLATLFDALKSVFGIWGGLQQLGMAKDAFNFEKEAYIENRDNQKQSYNSTLEDRQRARAAFAGESEAETQRYVDKHKLR